MASDFIETTPKIASGSVSSSSPETEDKRKLQVLLLLSAHFTQSLSSRELENLRPIGTHHQRVCFEVLKWTFYGCSKHRNIC